MTFTFSILSPCPVTTAEKKEKKNYSASDFIMRHSCRNTLLRLGLSGRKTMSPSSSFV